MRYKACISTWRTCILHHTHYVFPWGAVDCKKTHCCRCHSHRRHAPLAAEGWSLSWCYFCHHKPKLTLLKYNKNYDNNARHKYLWRKNAIASKARQKMIAYAKKSQTQWHFFPLSLPNPPPSPLPTFSEFQLGNTEEERPSSGFTIYTLPSTLTSACAAHSCGSGARRETHLTWHRHGLCTLMQCKGT